MKYSDAIKELRRRMLVSQTELAKMLGVSYATVNRWENGLHEPVYKAKRKLNKLLQKYDIDIRGQN